LLFACGPLVTVASLLRLCAEFRGERVEGCVFGGWDFGKGEAIEDGMRRATFTLARGFVAKGYNNAM